MLKKEGKKPGFTCFSWLTAFGPAYNSWQHNSIGLPENLAYFDSQCVGLEACFFFFAFFPFSFWGYFSRVNGIKLSVLLIWVFRGIRKRLINVISLVLFVTPKRLLKRVYLLLFIYCLREPYYGLYQNQLCHRLTNIAYFPIRHVKISSCCAKYFNITTNFPNEPDSKTGVHENKWEFAGATSNKSSKN